MAIAQSPEEAMMKVAESKIKRDTQLSKERTAKIKVEAAERNKANKNRENLKKIVQKDITSVQKGVQRVAGKIFDPSAQQRKQAQMARARAMRTSRAVTGVERQQLEVARQQAMARAKQMQMYLATLNEQEAMQFLEQNNVESTEFGSDGSQYANKFNRKLAYKKMYFDAVEAKKRFNERPKDWEQRRYDLEQQQMERQRQDWKRNNLLRAHESAVKMPKNWLVVDGTRVEAPNLFSRNNPNNRNVFDERGKPSILSAPNVFSADRFDVQMMNPLKAQNLFERGNVNNNIFSRKSPYHSNVWEQRKQPNILSAPNLWGNKSHQLNFGFVPNEDEDFGMAPQPKIKRSRKKKR
jgi:hypothetical protein